jgi:heme exporter protein D
MEGVNHLAFIIAAYAAAVAVIGGLTAWVLLDYRAQRHHLLELESKGVTRRSAARSGMMMEEVKEEA